MMNYIIKFIMIVIAIVVFNFIIDVYVKERVDTKLVEVEVFASRAYNELATYTDNIGKVHPATTKTNQFTQDYLDSQLDYAWKDYIAAEFALFSLGGDSSAPIYYNYDKFVLWEPKYRLEGPGATIKTIKKYPVTVIDDENIETQGYMYMTIMQLNQ